jgi:hypothetical protein
MILIATAIILLIMFFYELNNSFIGLNPITTYEGYKIYDIVKQRGLACAEAIEILDSDEIYDYYFDCLRSSKIYFVSDKEAITIHEAYDRGIISKEKLYELGIVDRMERSK